MKTSIKITRLIDKIAELQEELRLLEQSMVEVVNEDDRMENEGGAVAPLDYIPPTDLVTGYFVKRGVQY